MSEIIAEAEAWLAEQSVNYPFRELTPAELLVARLTAEVERHRMTAKERHAAGRCADDSYGVAMEYCVSDAASQSLHGYLARTESKEPSNG